MNTINKKHLCIVSTKISSFLHTPLYNTTMYKAAVVRLHNICFSLSAVSNKGAKKKSSSLQNRLKTLHFFVFFCNLFNHAETLLYLHTEMPEKPCRDVYTWHGPLTRCRTDTELEISGYISVQLEEEEELSADIYIYIYIFTFSQKEPEILQSNWFDMKTVRYGHLVAMTTLDGGLRKEEEGRGEKNPFVIENLNPLNRCTLEVQVYTWMFTIIV